MRVDHRAGLSTCRRGGVGRRQREPRDRRATAEMPPSVALLLWLDFGPSTMFTRMLSETRSIRCGSPPDAWAFGLCSQQDYWQGTGVWSLCVDAFPLHTSFQVGDFPENEVSWSWAEVYLVMTAGSAHSRCTISSVEWAHEKRIKVGKLPRFSLIFLFFDSLSCRWTICIASTLPYFLGGSLQKDTDSQWPRVNVLRALHKDWS